MPFRSTYLLPALLTLAVGFGSCGWSEEKEVKLTADQLPAAVKATLDKAAKGAVLSDVEKETKDGKTVYTAEIPGSTKGETVEFTVGEDGTLLKTETEKEDGKDDGDHK